MNVNPQPASREAAAKLGENIKRLHRHISSEVMRGMQAELTELDLSFSQVTALHQLRGGASSVTQLAERTHLSLPASSHLVERLVRRGLVERTENPENRREKLVALSPAGNDVLASMDSAFTEAYVTVLSKLPAEEVQATATSLEHLLERLDAQLSPPQEEKA